jgi:DNA-binding NarL/FixJ family response regulator
VPLTPLFERERELAELSAAIEAVAAGTGRLVAIEAKAGLGKTRLLEAARDMGSRAGLEALTARGSELERDFPFALVRQLFQHRLVALSQATREALFEGASAARRALGIDSGAAPAPDTFAVLHGLYWITAAVAERNPLVLAVDDVHWSDPASLDYLRFLLPRLEELPVLVLVTSRPDEPDLPSEVEQLVSDSMARLIVPRALSRKATIALLAVELDSEPEPAFAATCHEVSGGNPFLLRELARTLATQAVAPRADKAGLVRELAPERVARMVVRRVSRAGSGAVAVAQALAVLGDGSATRLVAALAQLDVDATVRGSDALRAGATLDPGNSLRFIHPLVRNAIYMDLSVGARAVAHARAAALLRAEGASPERIATHLVASEAQGDRSTVETLLEAGTRALATGAPQSAVTYLTQALQEPPPSDLRARVLEPLISAATASADQAALARIESETFAELERDPSLYSWGLKLTLWMALSGRFDRAVPILERAIEVAVSANDIDRAFQLEAQLGMIALLTPAAVQVRLERYAGKIEADSPAGRLMAALEVRAAAANGTASEAAEAAKRALAKDGAIFAEESELVSPAMAVGVLVGADEIAAAQHGADRATAIARERGATLDLMRAANLQGVVAWGRGDLPAAEADMRQSVEIARLAGIQPAVLFQTGPLMEVLIERDELDAAEAALRAVGMADAPMPANAMFGMLLLFRGHLRFEQGRFGQAAEDFATLSDEEESIGLGWAPASGASPFAVRTLVALGEHTRARELAESAWTVVQGRGAPASISHVLRARAAVAEGKAAVELLESAVTVLDDSPRRLQRAHALSELGAALRSVGRDADARAPLREGLKLARRCGAVRLAKRMHAELSACGEKVGRYSPIGVESLSSKERRVAELAASGMTNRQIAQDLFVTVKTVEAHLSASYDKLGIGSRRQLAVALGG